MLLVDLLLTVGAAALAAATYRKHRVAAIAGCGCLAVAALVFAHGRASAAVAPVTLGATELSHARREYFERTIARTPAHRVTATGLTRRDNARWFAHAKLGLFIHYGPTTLFGARTDRAWWKAVDGGRFDAAARAFRPNPRSVAGWVALAKKLGASYLTVTAKHHDGFGLWDSRLTGWDVGPHADLLKPLARECRRRHVRLFLYYSLLDRHEPTYVTDKDAYLVFVEGQLRELLTQYGAVAGVWFDGWDASFGISRLERVYRLVHSLQPWALVATNHHRRPLPQEDFRIFEDRFPRNVHDPSGLPREVAKKLGATWFWGGTPTKLDRLPSLLEHARRVRVNLLADVPPRPDGTFPPAGQAGDQNSSRLPSGS